MKSIGLVGKGFVGNAVYEGMKHAFDIVAWDKVGGWSAEKLGWHGHFQNEPEAENDTPIFNILSHTDGPIFVCVPTPMNKDGACDTSIVESVVLEIDKAARDLGQLRVAIVKSTVPPGTTTSLNEKVENIQVCFNPEFLREATAIDDFKNQDRIIIGGPRPATNVVKQMYATAYPDVPTTKTSSEIAELVKYVTNCFLATKVSFANEIKQICDALGVDYDKVVEYATKDKRLGSSHWAVPGPDGYLGFGLTCFPKDLNALMAKARELGVDPILMAAAWEKNLEVRSPEHRDWEKMIGRAVS